MVVTLTRTMAICIKSIKEMKRIQYHQYLKLQQLTLGGSTELQDHKGNRSIQIVFISQLLDHVSLRTTFEVLDYCKSPTVEL